MKKKEKRADVVAPGGLAEAAADLEPDAESEFLRRMAAIESGDSDRVPLEVLREMGKEYPPASDLDDATLASELTRLAEDLAFLHIYLESTDHLSDRELYERLLGEVLLEPTVIFPDDPSFGTHIDLIGGFGEEDIQIYLKYYADAVSRRHWKKDFPDSPMPRKERPPYDRDRFLPSHHVPRASR